MSLNYVTLVLNLYDGSGGAITQGTVLFTPSAQLTDVTDQQDITQAPVSAVFRAGLTAPQVTLLATDNGNVTPSGWGWNVTFQNVPGSPQPFSFTLPYANGATQYLSQVQVVLSPATMQAYATTAFVTTAIATAVPLTAKGDLLYENATPAPARLPIGSAGQVMGVSAGLPAWGAGMTLLASTGAAGYTLVNGTGNIITWTAPSDGNLHRITLSGNVYVTSAETGGNIGLSVTLPNGTNVTATVLAGASGIGLVKLANVGNGVYFVQAGTTVVISQTSALTAGAAVAWCELWGS